MTEVQFPFAQSLFSQFSFTILCNHLEIECCLIYSTLETNAVLIYPGRPATDSHYGAIL